MQEMKQIVNRLRDLLTNRLKEEAPTNGRRSVDLGAQVRDQVVRLLRRKDLRITSEVLLHDLRNAFSGFETFDEDNQRVTVEESLRIIENLDALLAAEQAYNKDRGELPPPPPATAPLVEKEERDLRRKEREAKERLKSERNKRRQARHTPSRRGKQGEGDRDKKGRSDLVFGADGKKRDQRSDQGGSGKHLSGGGKSESSRQTGGGGQQQASGNKRKSRRGGRRRSRRPKK